MTDRKIMQQALEALKLIDSDITWLEPSPTRKVVRSAIAALREKLAQPEQEPVAWLHKDSWGTLKLSQTMPPPVGAFPVYTAPQQEPVIDKSAAIRIATALGWEPPREEQEQEPVAKWDASAPLVVHPHPAFQATQQRREWVGLTEEEVKSLPQWFPSHETAAVLPLIRAIEAKLKEKNNG